MHGLNGVLTATIWCELLIPPAFSVPPFHAPMPRMCLGHTAIHPRKRTYPRTRTMYTRAHGLHKYAVFTCTVDPHEHVNLSDATHKLKLQTRLISPATLLPMRTITHACASVQPEIPADTPPVFAELMTHSWAGEASDRPTSAALLAALDATLLPVVQA